MPTLSYLQLKQALKKAKTPAVYNVTCTAADTEFSQSLPGYTKKFMIKARGGMLKTAYIAGQTATTYKELKDGLSQSEDNLGFEDDWLNLRFQSPTSGSVAEIEAWE